MVTQYIAMQPIMELYEENLWRLGTRVSEMCWEKDGFDLAGARAAAAEFLERELDMADGVIGGG